MQQRDAGLILILSEAWDHTAAEVLRWLAAWGRPVCWLHADDVLTSLDLPFHDRAARFTVARGLELDLDRVAAVWHRQGGLQIWRPEGLAPGLQALLQADAEVVLQELFARLRARPSLGLLPPGGVSQLQQLRVARALGLPVPDTLVSSSRAALQEFAALHGEIITKRIHYPPTFTHAGRRYSGGGTRILGQAEIASLDETFAPALVQARVPRAFDLRVFYLRGELFPMALLPPPGEALPVDVREADAAGRLRRTPYRLPEDVAAGLSALMSRLALDTGSIDLIVTPDDAHVFLEVNPQGQLEWLSHDCNYHLEKRIAEALIALADGAAP